jgi:hypothetical protein
VVGALEGTKDLKILADGRFEFDNFRRIISWESPGE